MNILHPINLFAVLGPMFLVLGAAHCLRARSITPPGKTWLIIGLMFSVVAVWLRWNAKIG